MSHISEADLQSYVDSEADPETRARVERYIAARPDEARRVRETREDMALLRRYFTAMEAHIPDRQLADTLRLVVDHTPRRRLAVVPAGLRIAAMLAFLLVGSVAVMAVKLSMTVPAYADAAAVAYENVAKEPAESEDELAPDPRRLVDWLNEKTGLVIRVPYSEAHGFNLTEGRLTRFDRRAAGLLVYEDWRHHRVVIFVTRVGETEDPHPHFAFDRATHINYWSHNGIGVVIAAADEHDLREFTQTSQEQIDVSLLPPAAH